jgi:tRNA 2-thiouridine synthesizing protein A
MADMEQSIDRVLDAKGLNCPLPVLKTRKALRDVPLGELLTVLATDPASTIDVRHFCNLSGQELIESSEADGVYTFVIRRTR